VHWKYFESAKPAIEHLKQNQYKVFAVEQVTGSISLIKLHMLHIDKIAFIFCNEVSGIDPETLPLCDGFIEIPQFGIKHSLNISVAAGIVLWEAIKTNSFNGLT